MLEHLGIKAIRLMTNNPRKVKALSDAGVQVVERVPLQVGQSAQRWLSEHLRPVSWDITCHSHPRRRPSPIRMMTLLPEPAGPAGERAQSLHGLQTAPAWNVIFRPDAVSAEYPQTATQPRRRHQPRRQNHAWLHIEHINPVIGRDHAIVKITQRQQRKISTNSRS